MVKLKFRLSCVISVIASVLKKSESEIRSQKPTRTAIVNEILAAGADRLAPMAAETLAEVRQKMGLR